MRIQEIPNLDVFLILERPEPLCYVCLSVRPSVTPAVSGIKELWVRRADEQQKLSSLANFVRLEFKITEGNYTKKRNEK